MKITVNSKKGLKTSLKIFVDKKTIEEKIENRIHELKSTVNLKGFRPGKVPLDLLKKQFGKAVYGEILDKILKETSLKAIEEKKIKPIGQPKIDLKIYGEGKDLEYLMQIEELPEIKFLELSKIKVINYDINVSKDVTEKKLNEIGNNQNNFVDKKDGSIADQGDLVIIDFDATIDGSTFEGGKGKNTQLILGKDLFIKGFDKQLIGVKKNETKDIHVVLPDNYPNKEYANKKAIFKCKILNVRRPEKIVINDEFAKNLGAKDLNDLRLMISKQIKGQYKTTLDSITKKEILDQLDSSSSFTVPETLIEQEISLFTQGLKKEDLEKRKKENENIAKKRIKIGLILNEIGEKNNLKVTDEEFKSEIQKQVNSMPGQSKEVLDYYQKNPSASSSLRGTIYEEKIINLVKKNAKSVEKVLSIKEAEKIIKNANSNPNENKETVLKKKNKDVKKTTKSKSKKNKIRKK